MFKRPEVGGRGAYVALATLTFTKQLNSNMLSLIKGQKNTTAFKQNSKIKTS